MFITATYTVQCDTQQAFTNAMEEAKKMHPNLMVVSSSFRQRSVYNDQTHRYEYPGDFTGSITMGVIQTNNTRTTSDTFVSTVLPSLEPDLYNEVGLD